MLNTHFNPPLCDSLPDLSFPSCLHCRLFTAFHIFFNLPRSASLCLIAFLSRLLYQIRFRKKLWRIRIREALFLCILRIRIRIDKNAAFLFNYLVFMPWYSDILHLSTGNLMCVTDESSGQGERCFLAEKVGQRHELRCPYYSCPKAKVTWTKVPAFSIYIEAYVS
jgi:hypothetical protein